MPIESEADRDIIRPKHQMVVPGLGVFIAPKAVARLFQLHDYTRCPNFRKKHVPMRAGIYRMLFSRRGVRLLSERKEMQAFGVARNC